MTRTIMQMFTQMLGMETVEVATVFGFIEGILVASMCFNLKLYHPRRSQQDYI